ncbi:beta-aspartyl-peptidase [Tepidimicrobium xylanilyticum]|uniref:Isoaspartyl dipeptidase n=1 Tax=Tepidimicrobium xylanilyticum TaxID=1123352 RepID=A0A1H2W5D2_9FIRM|nr:beta-aspartyl-peptidase [Tepidimicrobium xylanilyticum]SDW75872.1 beta-aspartyl-dipeptidase (metallo-type) [Tepidimicrobium xylanilyticum]
MITIIRNINVYKPEPIGIKDILLMGDKIAAIEDKIHINLNGLVEVKEIDGTGKILVPGFIDCHVHILGGGGEGGFSTRTPEATLSSFTTAGVTTVVGTLGTDGVARDMNALLAKARGLEEEGITTYVYTGSYRLPLNTLTGEIMKDIMFIDKVIGIGEVAISDHRSSQPTFEEFIRAAADARVAGMLSGKAGIVNVHVGDGPRKLEFLFRTIEETEIPITQFLPTHINRNSELFEDAIKYAKMGGYIDFTASEDPELWEEQDGEVSFSKGLKRILEEGIHLDNFTLSSDGQGSLPIFNEKKEFVGIGVGKSISLLVGIKDCVFNENIPLEIAIRAVTCNPAKILKLNGKGRIERYFDADLCILDEKSLDIDMVIAKGKIMVENRKAVVFGTFEE